MPYLTIQTNQSVADEEPQVNQFLTQLSQMIADILNKPESYVMISYQHNPHMYFSGNQKPLAYLELKSLNLPEQKTTELSRALCSFLQQQLSIDQNRIYIEFTNGQRHLWGWNGGTF